ncbi:MAG: DUF6443 domain-containing protein, partial [Bacteroidota bacterium]|nr:DUF6443 domain-containing protein [Bacteroidota bacterium]
MKLIVLSALMVLCLSSLPARAQVYGSMNNPIDIGYFDSGGSTDFYDSNENNDPSNGFGNNIGQLSDDVWYKFTVTSTTVINISLCGSDFDTYLHLLDENENELESNDDNGPLCVGLQSSIQTTLSPGTYYAVVEGYEAHCGNIVMMINNAGGSYSIDEGMYTAINAGSFDACGSRTFMDSRSNSTYYGYGNKYGQGSDDIFYRFTISATALVNISLCGSDFDTYLHLLDASGAEIESNNNDGPLCTGLQSSIQTTLLPGTYYAVAEGWSFNSGNIAIEISTGSGSPPPGTSLSNAIDAGTLSTPFTDTRNNSPEGCYQNLMGQPSNEIYYKFTLPTSSQVGLSHCGTAFDTYLHLLDNRGVEIAANNDNGPLCAGSQASIKMTLGAGTYYVVSEGFNTNSGDIITTIFKYPPPSANFSQNQNYIVTYTPNISGMMDADSVRGKDIAVLSQQVQYFDGLGRPMQNVIFKGSPLLNDIVQPIAYDSLGREPKQYLPYVSTINDGSYKSDALTEQATFYTGTGMAAKCATDNRPFSETVFEPSPLDRPLQQYGAGEGWYSGHPIAIDHQVNTANEVRLWTMSGSTVSAPGYYNAGTLFKTQTTDENGNKSWEFKDLQEQVVLKQVESESGPLNTYYVYDDFARLAYVIPPKATAFSYPESSDDFKELIYAYKYDGRGRMTEKHIPGTGWIYMVYNKIDKLILSQDSLQRASKDWIFTKYDALGRVVMTGKVVIDNTRINIQGLVDNETNLWESRNDTLTGSYYYTTDSYPQGSFSSYEVLTVNYYDTYSFDSNLPTYQQALGNAANSIMTKGLLTGSKVKVLDGSNTWLTSVSYYDDKARPIQVFNKNILGTWDRVTSKYDFTGKLLQSERTHDALTLNNRYVYDQAGRKKEVYEQVNSDPEVELAEYNYNELGQLVKKNLHKSPTGRLQGIDYRYNIRGWLTSINSAKLDDDGVLNEESDDAFGEELSYNESFNAGGTSGTA